MPALLLVAALLCGARAALAVNEFPAQKPQAAWAAKAASGVAPDRPAGNNTDAARRAPAREAPAAPSSSGRNAAAAILGAVAVGEGIGIAELRKQNKALQAQNQSLRAALDEANQREAGLAQANQGLEQRVKQASESRAEQQAALDQARRELERGGAGLEAAKQQIGELQKTVQSLKGEQVKAAEKAAAREALLAAEAEQARRDRWVWATAAAALGAGLAAAAVRALWPRKLTVAQPFSVSVSAGTWSTGVSGAASGALPAFRLHTRWEPGAVSVQAAGGLLREPQVVSLLGEAA